MPRSTTKPKKPVFETVTFRLSAEQRATLDSLAERFAAKHGFAVGAQSHVVRLLIERYGDQFVQDEGL